MGMCAMAGKKMKGYADGGEIDPEMQRQIDALKAKHNAPPKPSMFSGLFGGSPKPAPAAPPAQPQSLVGTIQNRNDELKKAAGYANGGKIKGPGTPTSDSIPAQVKQTGEPIAVSTGERILSKKQDMFLQKIAQGAGFDSLDAMLEHGTGKPVGPTMKGGMAAAEYGANPDDIIRSGNSFSQPASPASAALTDVNSYGNSMTQTNKMNANPTAFAAREPGMAGTNIYANGAGTSTGLSGAVNYTSSDASTITPPPMNGVGAQQQAIAQPLSTGSADLDTLGTDQGSAPKFANKSMSDIAKEQGIGNMAYRPGGIGDPNASNPMARQAAPVQRQRKQATGIMPTVDDMFQKRGFADGGKVVTLPNGRVVPLTPMVKREENPVDLNAGYTQNPNAVTIGGKPNQEGKTIVVPGNVDMNAYTPEPGFNPLAATTGMLADSAAAARGQGSYEELRAKRPDSIGQKPQSVMSQASYSNEAKAPVAVQGINQGSQEARIAELAKQSAQAAAATTGFVGQQVNNTGSVSGRSNVDATKLQAPDGGGFITNAQGKAMFLPPQAIAARDPNGQYDANGNNMARTNQMKAELAGMQRDRLVRDMGADITSPGTRYAAQQQLAQLDKGQGMALMADRAQRDDVTAGLDQQGKRNSLAEYANLQKAIDEYSKMPAGQERDAAMEAIAARQGRNLPDRSQLIHAAGGSDPNDPMGMRKMPDRIYEKDKYGVTREITAQQQSGPQSFKTPDEVEVAKKAGKLKPGDVVLINGRQARIN